MDNFLKNLPALFCSFIPKGSFPRCPIDYPLEKLEFCFSTVEWPDFTLHLTHVPDDYELHQHMLIAAQAASSLNHEVQYCLPPIGLSITWLRKLSYMRSRSLLDYLQFIVLLSWQMSRLE